VPRQVTRDARMETPLLEEPDEVGRVRKTGDGKPALRNVVRIVRMVGTDECRIRLHTEAGIPQHVLRPISTPRTSAAGPLTLVVTLNIASAPVVGSTTPLMFWVVVPPTMKLVSSFTNASTDI
jgi:hypothetical protein